MGLKEKLDLLINLSEREKNIAKEKFLASFAYVSEEELKDIIGYLDSQGVKITKAREIKVFANLKTEIAKKFNILSEIHETGIYKQDPTLINRNVIDIYKKINYCIQTSKPYKSEGKYESFLFNELSWKKEFNKENVVEELPIVEPILTQEPVIDKNHIDIKDIINNSIEIEENIAKTTSFADLKEELANLKEELDKELNDIEIQRENLINQKEAVLKEFKQEKDTYKVLSTQKVVNNKTYNEVITSEDEISFNDLEPETYGMGRAA